MRCWHVYEHVKRVYLRTGRVLTKTEARAAFPELRWSECMKGYYEFLIALRDHFPVVQDKQKPELFKAQ